MFYIDFYNLYEKQDKMIFELIPLIPLIIVITIFYFIIQIKDKESNFWKNQPVIRDKFNWDGYLFNSLPEFELKLPNTYKFSYNYSVNKISEWITDNFSEYKWEGINKLFDSSNNRNNEKLNITLTEGRRDYEERIIGFIHVRFMEWNFEDKIEKLGFVDYLCVDREYRNKNIAAVMISEMMNRCRKDGLCLGFIFKIDRKELSFPYWQKMNYLIKELDFDRMDEYENIEISFNDSIKFLNKENLEKQFDIFPLLTEEQYRGQYFDSEIYKVYGIKDTIICLGREGKLYDKLIFDIDQIIYLMDNGEKIQNNIWEKLEKGLSRKYKYISCVESCKIGKSKDIIDGWIEGNNLYFYFYNFSWNQKKNRERIWVNFN